MNDKIAEIKERHLHDDRWRNGPSMISAQAHDDRATLLAEVEKLREGIERLTGKLKLVADALNDTISKYHEVGDQNDRLDADLERLRADLALEKSRIVLQRGQIERLRADVERLRVVYVLIASRQSGPVDSATCWYEDKIIGCYISREAAEGAAKLLMADWRINEYALVGKP